MLAIRWSKMRNFIWPTSKSAIVVQFSAAAAANSVRITQSNTSHRLPGIARPFFMGGKFMAGVGDRLPDGPISSLLPPLQPTHLQHTHTHSQPPPFVVHCRSWDWVEFGSWVGGAAWQIARHLTAASIQRQFRLIFLYFHFAFFFCATANSLVQLRHRCISVIMQMAPRKLGYYVSIVTGDLKMKSWIIGHLLFWQRDDITQKYW